jgi:hypothetical protein
VKRLPFSAALAALGILGLAARPARAQGSPFTAVLVVPPYPSPFLADWQRNPQMATLTLLYSGTGRADFRVLGTVTSATQGELARVISPPFSYLTGPVTQIITSADVLDWNTVSRNQAVTDAALRTGMIPEGPIQICAFVQDLSGAELAQACSDFTIAFPDPPQLIFPSNGGSTAGAQPVFQWTPVMAPPELGVSYRVRIVELLSGQNPETAIAANPTWFQTDMTGAPMLVYPLDALPLDPQKQYAWEVQALDANGDPLTRGGQSSEIWTFSVAGLAGEGAISDLPDVLDLIPGVARVSGLKSADVQAQPASYQVNGQVTLELLAPFQAQLKVEAQDLDLDRATIAAGGGALVRSGSLRGSLGSGDVPASLGGTRLQFTQIDFASGAGLTLKGRLTLPGAAGSVDLDGQVQLTAAGAYGTLTADAGTGTPLLALGQDPARLLVQHARVTLPGGAMSVSGGLELFGRDLGCGGVNATIAGDGSLAANVACMPSAPLPLGAGGSRAQLALRSVTGTFAAGAGGAAPNYSLSLSSELRLDAGTTSFLGAQSGGANCGGSLALTVANGAVSTSSFTARCDAGEGDADLGWLHARLSSLALQRFAYTPGQGFDFALTLDLAPWVPAITGLELPAATAVTITPAGLGVPALDVAVTRAPFDLAGFGVRVTHVRLPAFTLSWSDWSARSAGGFQFSVDAEVSFPGLPGSAPGCLAQPLTITAAEIAGGKFRAHLDQRKFQPPCRLTLFAASGAADTASGATPGTATGAGTAGNPDEWNPYQAMQEPPLSDPPLLEAQNQWPADSTQAAALRQRELSAVEAAEQALRDALNDPQCDSTCRAKAKKKYQDLQTSTWSIWHDRDFGEREKRLRTCLENEQQRALAGQQPQDSTCGIAAMYASLDSVVKAVLPRLTPPQPPATADCDNDLGYAMQVVLNAERQMTLLNAAETPNTLAEIAPITSYCANQRKQRLQNSCKAIPKPTRALLEQDFASYTAGQRQLQLLSQPGDPFPGLDADICDWVKPVTTSMGRPRSPPDLRMDWTSLTPAGGPFVPDLWTVADTVDLPAKADVSATPASLVTGASGGLTLDLDGIGGDLVVGFSPYLLVEQVPTIDASVVLPAMFECADSTARQLPLMSKLRFGPHGELDGTILGFLPSCPIDLAAVRVTVTDASLSFSTASGNQSIVLAAAATATFTLSSTPVQGQGSVAIDLLHGRLLSGSLGFQGPLAFALPRETPVLSFVLPSLSLDPTGVHVDGRAQLAVTGGPAIGATFDQVTINPQTVAITSGQVSFDAPFALEVGVGADGGLTWRAEPAGAPLSVQAGLRVDLPSRIALGAGGFTASGDGAAHLVFGGRDVDSLVTKFSTDFALGFGPPGVVRGMVDLQRNGVSLAYVDRSGFHPNVAYFAGAALPAQLPLPSAGVAYLELRDAAGTLRVSTQNTGNGIRIFTAAGATVPLVLPALQLGRPAAPRLLVTLDLTLDPLGQNVALGSLGATVSPADADAFDLSSLGLPVALERLAYDRVTGGGYHWTLDAALKLFGQRQEPGPTDQVRLTLDGTGHLAGTVSLAASQTIPLVAGSQNAALTLDGVQGTFDAVLPTRDIRFQLAATGGIQLQLGPNQTYRAGATVNVSDQGVQVGSLTYQGSDTPVYLDLQAFKLGVQHLRVPKLDYTAAGGFDFQILFDASLQFPSLGNVTLPPLQDVALTRGGFAIPAYEVPDLNTDLPSIGGFAAKLLAFRMGQIGYNWFTGQAPANWGFGFDLELGFGTLMAGVPPALQSARVRVLNAGLTNGHLTGTVERLAFPAAIDLGVGKLNALSGQLPADPSNFALTAEFDLDLSAVFPICNGAALKRSASTLSIGGNGWMSGTISGVLPSCTANLGPFAVAFGQSDVTLGTAGTGSNLSRSIEVALAATVKFPGVNAGDTVSASGSLRFDALQGKWLSGSIALAQPFRYQPADKNPYLAFTVQTASLDNGGLHFTGQGSLNAQDGAQVTAQFNNFTLDLPSLTVKSGGVTFLNQFALGVGISNGSLQWGAYAATAPRPSGPSFRAVVPDTVTIDAQGLYLGGTASAELAYGDTTFGTLQVKFQNGFRVGFAPLAVTGGRANFIVGTDEIAHVDAGGFWPGNVFGVLPIPAKLGLPSADIAYLELRDGSNNLLIDMQTSPNGIELKTKAGPGVRLVVPALAKQGQTAPAVNVAFDVVVNQSNLQFVSGSVHAQADPASSLLALDQLGVPLSIRGISWDRVGATYALTLAGRITLPASLNGLNVDVPNLTLSASGLSGEVRMGSYIQGQSASSTPIASQSFMGDTLQVAMTGALLQFGGQAPSVSLSGYVSSALFAAQGQSAAQLNWTGSVTPGSFALELDPTKNPAILPLAVAQFQPMAVGTEPALRVSADAQEFKVRMSGVLTVPTISPTLAVTIAGLQVGTKGIVFPTVSIQGVDQQQFDLFGATFHLKDSTAAGTTVFPAIAVGVKQGAVALTLSGELDFLGNTSRFYGLTVSTSGQVSIAAASLISHPIAIIQDVLSVDALTLQNNALRTDLSVTLPDPLNGSGPQKVNFTVDASGHVTGGANLAVINEQPSITGSSATHFALGDLATVHLRYLGLNLDFADLRHNSSVDVVSDVYLQNTEDNRIKLGDVAGNTVQPGVRIGFDGTVTWGNLALTHEFNFDFDALKLTVSNVAFPAQQTGFAISLSGGLSLAIEDVTSDVKFHDFVVTSRGDVQFPATGIDKGTFTIAHVVKVGVSQIGFSASPATIQVRSGSMPTSGGGGQTQGPTSSTQTINVDSYFTFGASISVDDAFSGGVDRFLVYQAADKTTHLLIQNAQFSIVDVVDVSADFRYDQSPSGFEMLVGGQGTLWSQYHAAVVGAIEDDAGKTRLGMFLAASGLKINLTPYLRLDGVGGGFFLNPRPEYIDMVRQAAQVSQTAAETALRRIPPASNMQYALMFYGQMAFLQGAIEGTSLTTISDQQLLLDGTVVILGQTGRLTGDHHLAVGLKQAYAEGTMDFKANYGAVLTGGGPLAFFAYDDQNWGVYGTTQVTIVDFLKGTSDLFIGPPGFYVKSHIGANYNVAILTVDGSIDATVWYIGPRDEWGGYTSLGVEASVLGGLASAQGTLEGALILDQGQPFIFAAAELKASIVGQSWDGWVWARIQNQEFSGGLGADPAIVAAIEEAKHVADSMAAAKSAATDALNQAKQLGPPGVSLTADELAAAYRNLQRWNDTAYAVDMALLEQQEDYPVADPANVRQYQNWYVDVLRQKGAPGDTNQIRQYATDVANGFASLESSRPQVEARIAALSLSIQSLSATATNPTLPSGNPVQSASVAAPVAQDVLGATPSSSSGPCCVVGPAATLTYRHLTSGPGFNVDAAAAAAGRVAASNANHLAGEVDLAVRQQIVALESGLATVRAATATGDPGSLPALVGQYGAVAAKAEQQFAAQADYLLGRGDWLAARLTDLHNYQPLVNSWLFKKDSTLAVAGSRHNAGSCQTDSQSLYALALARLGYLNAFLSDTVPLVGNFETTFCQQPTFDASRDFARKQADSSGIQVWYRLGDAGMSAWLGQVAPSFAALKTQADQRLGTIRSAHASLSQSLAGLYQLQANATGTLYDLYDRYLASGGPTAVAGGTRTLTLPGTLLGTTKVAAAQAPTVTTLLDPTFLSTRRDQLAQDLTVPRINSVQVTATGASRYAAQVQVAWSAWHPGGAYEFEFRDAEAGGASAPLYSNGATGLITSYRFTPDPTAASTSNRSVTVGARGGAGFVGLGRTNYSLSFQPGSSAPASLGGGAGLASDNTPPSIPVVEFPDLAQRLDSTGTPTAWTSDPTRVAAQWSADDPESGVGLYEYALWSTPTGTTGIKSTSLSASLSQPVVRPFTAAGGRTSMTIDLALSPGQPLYLAVRATNAQGGVSTPGVSLPLRYDPTPPVFPAGAALSLTPATVPAPPAGAVATYAGCPVIPAALPGTLPALSVFPPPPVISWTGTLGPTTTPGATPQVNFVRPDASDPQSGLAGYYYHVSTQPGDTVYDPSWSFASTRTTSFIASGAPLDYQNPFWIALVAKNVAGSVSRAITYGPFRITDPTAPAPPVICAGAGAAGQMAVQITTPATDHETPVTGYQYRIHDIKGAVVRAWPGSLTPDWPASGTTAIARGLLTDGGSYFLDVQAINQQNEVSGFVTSGPVLFDASPPPSPTASVTVAAGVPYLVANAPTDPHSGLATLQWAVGSTSTSADVQPWIESSIPAEGGTVTLPIPVALPGGTTLWLQLRSVNGAGLASTMFTSSFLVPASKVTQTQRLP